MTAKISELRLDVEQLKGLLETATRNRVKDLLVLNIAKLETEITKLVEREESAAKEGGDSNTGKPRPVQANMPFRVKLSTYGWENDGKFIKVYVTLKNVHNIPKENVSVEFTETSMSLNVSELDGKSYNLPIHDLLQLIDPSSSSHKVKTDMVLVNLRKKDGTNTWNHVTKSDVKKTDAKAAAPSMGKDAGEDPNKAMMNIMKKMYDEGDDEMKRSIAKAWTEGKEKGGGGFPGLPGF
ncbi:PREDICTED: calcyclin-binding protein-like [Priapulus caudatus]|uniref:Calcyclin-binding protein n=1 Tax=Priapulus caudatus TaxID=37621 RepID=A0ABM1EVM9_PRICU|nr:PREDICTED: calcyclin-binding protein-like [Priapulus caudatus]